LLKSNLMYGRKRLTLLVHTMEHTLDFDDLLQYTRVIVHVQNKYVRQ